ncbi:hypothetical protein [Pseudomonas sp. RA_35y_Pfl2_P32]|uniref:hypothetical protein n=1 Tax=Pseudomonas sp. RA_35y_Pfl2_P32 TaxID=3088705 RepID=UPI0030DC3A29
MSSDGIYGMTPAGCVERIRRYELADSSTLRARGFTSPEVEAPEKGAIVGEGILSFTGNLSEQNRDDVMHAFLFATLVANKAFPREEQGKEWYYKFVEAMMDAGWMFTQKFYNDINVGGNSVRMDQLVLEILGGVVAGTTLPGSTSALMLKVAGSAISALKKRETALTLYERNVLEHGVGGTAAGTCTEINGEVTLALGTVRFIRKNTSAQVLFADWDTRDVKLYRGESVFRKVSSIVEQTRDEILRKLGGNAKTKIANYEI